MKAITCGKDEWDMKEDAGKSIVHTVVWQKASLELKQWKNQACTLELH